MEGNAVRSLTTSRLRGDGTARYEGSTSAPVFRREVSFRGQSYRLLHHQNGICGHVVARILQATTLPTESIGSRSGSADATELPCINLNVGKSWRSSSPASRDTPCLTWFREVLHIEVVKDTLKAGEPIVIEVQACRRARNVLSTAMNMAKVGTGDVLALGVQDITDLILGNTEFLDVWVDLQPKGRVQLHIEYESKGITPQAHDVVYLESFARWPGSVIIPAMEPLVVQHTRKHHMLVAVRTSDNFIAQIRLHRNVVFVVERLSWWDNTLQLTSRPVDALLQTDFGSWAMRKCRPLLLSAAVLIGPISASCQIAVTTAKLAAKTALHGSIAMAKESFS